MHDYGRAVHVEELVEGEPPVDKLRPCGAVVVGDEVRQVAGVGALCLCEAMLVAIRGEMLAGSVEVRSACALLVNMDRAFPIMSEMAKFDESQVRIAPRSTSRPDHFSASDCDPLFE